MNTNFEIKEYFMLNRKKKNEQLTWYCILELSNILK